MTSHSFGTGWRFGAASAGSDRPEFDDSGFAEVTLPHTVVPLSWRDWDPAAWERDMSDKDLLTHLPRVAAAGAQVEQQLTRWVRMARSRGITWTRIGAALGMTRQSAWERFSGED